MTLSNTTVNGELFKLGKVVITRGALALCEDHDINYFELIMRHATGDFGDTGNLNDAELSEEEQELGALVTDDGLKLNAIAVNTSCGMIMSVYSVSGGLETKLWVQTLQAEADTYTTLLKPSEY